MNKFVVFIFTILSLQESYAGTEGHGGDVWDCKDGRVMFLDFYDAKLEGMKVSIPKGDRTDKTERVLQRVKLVLERTSMLPEIHKELSLLTDKFFAEALIESDVRAKEIDDSDPRLRPVGCSLKQVVFQEIGDLMPGQKRYYVAGDYWDQLTEEEQVGLVLHEVLFQFYTGKLKADDLKDSIFIRRVVSLLSTDYWLKLNVNEQMMFLVQKLNLFRHEHPALVSHLGAVISGNYLYNEHYKSGELSGKITEGKILLPSASEGVYAIEGDEVYYEFRSHFDKLEVSFTDKNLDTNFVLKIEAGKETFDLNIFASRAIFYNDKSETINKFKFHQVYARKGHAFLVNYPSVKDLKFYMIERTGISYYPYKLYLSSENDKESRLNLVYNGKQMQIKSGDRFCSLEDRKHRIEVDLSKGELMMDKSFNVSNASRFEVIDLRYNINESLGVESFFDKFKKCK